MFSESLENYFGGNMKNLLLAVSVVFIFISCSTVSTKNEIDDTLDKYPFEHYFPGPSNNFSFDSIDEAYNYVNSATQKISHDCDKQSAKGLAAKLLGPTVKGDKPVSVSYFLVIYDHGSYLDLSKPGINIRETVKNSIATTCVFLIFYGERGVSISDYYLKGDYRYSSNSQYESFNYNHAKYIAKYPIGWGIDKSFKYLKKEID
jgi:hypothetical protein